MAADPTRRALLAAAGLPLLLTACRGVQVLGSPPPPPAEVRTLRAAIAAEERLVHAYVAASQPGSGSGAAVLAGILAEHRQHLGQLKSRLIESAAQRSAAAASATATGPAGQGAQNPALPQLEQAEAAASDWLIGQLGGLPPSLAQLFASIAASEATHIPVLRSAGRRP